MKRIIFVCTGNTCRSPIAEALAIKSFSENNINIEVISRGILVSFPSPANEYTVDIVKNKYPNIKNHIAISFTEDEVDKDTLVLTMTESHKNYILVTYPNIKDNVATLKEYLDELGDVKDPYGCSKDVYMECANEISLLINKLTKKIL
ncbi:MAG: low molecular weight protein arginine phosphatase [Vallitalea sp.]|jgi:protein-tyrosine phosphatase|nr:low molecular weight protein arginine phosphatase [Vallitalea sp.]